jgi:hypothetical protein
VHRTKETDRDRDRNSAAARGAAAMEGEESAAAVPDPGFVLDAASGLYYHARFAFVSWLSLLSRILLQNSSLPKFQRPFFLLGRRRMRKWF